MTAKKYDKDFFKSWSAAMAYSLGFLYADGNIVKNKLGGHYISVYSADRIILQSLKNSWQSTHKLSVRCTLSGKVYRLQVGSKEWFADLGKLGLHPSKTKRLELPVIPKEFLGDFIRGYFDGDGNVWVGKIHKDRKMATLTIQVAFTSGSYDFLVSLRDVLHENGLQGGSVFRLKQGEYGRLIFSVRDALNLYEIMYNGPCKLLLVRKRAIFEQFYKMRE